MKSAIYCKIILVRHSLLIILLSVFCGTISLASALEKNHEIKGVFVSKSYKAKLVALQVADQVQLFHYDTNTEGLDDIDEGDNVLLRYSGEEQKKVALKVVPDLVKIPPGVTEVDTEDMLLLVNNKLQHGKYLLVDCRPAEFYAETHLPGAVSIPWTEVLETKLAALPLDKEFPLIFYCLGGTCRLGPSSAALAVEAGYKNVRVFLAELDEWQENGGKLYSSDSYVVNGNVVLVDLRTTKETEMGHIPGAVHIPIDDIPDAEYDFPVKKSAPIVLYGKKGEAEGVQEIIMGWGFHQVSYVEGGYDGWVARGNTKAIGRMPSQIRWQPRLDDGEISVDEFKKVLGGISSDTVIVDVRTSEESAKGSFEGAIKIPMNELEDRLGEIPENKKIYLHCATGSRAKMAWSYLRQHRKQVNYLPAKVSSRKGRMSVKR